MESVFLKSPEAINHIESFSTISTRVRPSPVKVSVEGGTRNLRFPRLASTIFRKDHFTWWTKKTPAFSAGLDVDVQRSHTNVTWCRRDRPSTESNCEQAGPSLDSGSGSSASECSACAALERPKMLVMCRCKARRERRSHQLTPVVRQARAVTMRGLPRAQPQLHHEGSSAAPSEQPRKPHQHHNRTECVASRIRRCTKVERNKDHETWSPARVLPSR